MTDIQDLLKQYTTIDAQDTITPAMIDDWLLSELSTAIYTSKLPRIAPRPIHTADTNYISLNSKRPSDASEDEIALKRQKNTDAARRSRLKKMLKMETLEKRVADLESENQTLTTRVAVLESEKSGLESKDQSLEERIRALEDQLAEAHRALTQSINKKN